MGRWHSAADRRDSYDPGEHKGLVYRDSACWLFVESDPKQAAAIHEASGKAVLCPKMGAVFQ